MKLFISLSIMAVFLMSSCKQSSSKKRPEKEEHKTETTKPVLLSQKSRKAFCVYLVQDENNKPLISWVEVDTVKNKKHFYFSKIDTTTGKFTSKKVYQLNKTPVFTPKACLK